MSRATERTRATRKMQRTRKMRIPSLGSDMVFGSLLPQPRSVARTLDDSCRGFRGHFTHGTPHTRQVYSGTDYSCLENGTPGRRMNAPVIHKAPSSVQQAFRVGESFQSRERVVGSSAAAAINDQTRVQRVILKALAHPSAFSQCSFQPCELLYSSRL